MDSNPIVGYEKVKVTEIPLSAFDGDYENSEEGGDRSALGHTMKATVRPFVRRIIRQKGYGMRITEDRASA